MRTRDQIEDSVYYCDEDADRTRVRLDAILEVLLDIRELLPPPEGVIEKLTRLGYIIPKRPDWDEIEKSFTQPVSDSSSSKEV